MRAKACLLLFLLLLLPGLSAAAEPAVGDVIPAFDSVLLDGSTLEGSTLAGRPVLVMFWATWCSTCRKELPEVQKLYNRYKSRGFEVIAVSIDAERLDVDEFLKDFPYTLPVAMRTARHSEIFGPTRYPPRFFLIGRDGKLALRHFRALAPGQLEAALKPLL